MRAVRSLPLAVLLALLLLAGPSYAKVAKIAEESMLEQARRHFLSGKYAFATTWLGRILRDYPATPHRKEVLLLLAKGHALSGRDEKATPYLRDLMKEFPEATATLEPALLQLAKAAEPPPAELVAKPPAPPPPAGEQPAVPAAGLSLALPTPPAPRVPEPAQPPARPAQVPAATAPSSPPETVEKTAGSPTPAHEKPATAPPAAELAPPPAKPSPSAKPPLPSPASEYGKAFYTLAAGETVNRGKFESLLKKAEATGYLPVVQVETKKSEVYRLVSESCGSRKSVEKRRGEISRRGVGDAFVIRSEGAYCVVAGSLMSENAALQEQKRLAGKGVKVRVARSQVPLTVWRVSVGRFADALEAEEAARMLAARGIGATVVKVVD